MDKLSLKQRLIKQPIDSDWEILLKYKNALEVIALIKAFKNLRLARLSTEGRRILNVIIQFVVRPDIDLVV